MYKRIIVAIDGSSTSKRALRAALTFAKERRSAVRIVHVVDFVNLSAETEYAFTEYERSARKYGERILQQAAAIAHAAGVKAETKLLQVQTIRDRIADKVAREARDWRAELIVIGTHGRRGASRLFLGSVAESIARIAPTPVLLFRGK